jgi:hypothetical protein
MSPKFRREELPDGSYLDRSIDHIHVDGVEREYRFVSEERLLEDFLLEIRKLGSPV